MDEKEKDEINYKAIILVFTVIQVMVAILQLVQSTIDGDWTKGKIINFVGLFFIAIFLLFFIYKIESK